MIKRIRDLKSKSYWRDKELYNIERHKKNALKVFGITVWSNVEDFVDEVVADIKEAEGVGFKSKKYN